MRLRAKEWLQAHGWRAGGSALVVVLLVLFPFYPTAVAELVGRLVWPLLIVWFVTRYDGLVRAVLEAVAERIRAIKELGYKDWKVLLDRGLDESVADASPVLAELTRASRRMTGEDAEARDSTSVREGG
jgi:hypothetical protein